MQIRFDLPPRLTRILTELAREEGSDPRVLAYKLFVDKVHQERNKRLQRSSAGTR